MHHDHSISNITGLDIAVEDINYSEIPLSRDVVGVNMGFQEYKLQSEDDGRIPLLKDVFKDYPDMPMNIDLKGGSDELVQAVYDLIVEYQRADITYWGDMNETRNIVIKEKGLSHGIRTFCSIKYTFLLCLYYYLGILPFIPLRHHSIWYPFFGQAKTDGIVKLGGGKCKHKCVVGLYN